MNLDEIKAKAEKRIKYSESCDETSLAYTILKLVAALEKCQFQRDVYAEYFYNQKELVISFKESRDIENKEIEEILRGEV